jgi:hypothetical protein
VDLSGHEAGNGGYSQRKPTAHRDSSTRKVVIGLISSVDGAQRFEPPVGPIMNTILEAIPGEKLPWAKPTEV